MNKVKINNLKIRKKGFEVFNNIIYSGLVVRKNIILTWDRSFFSYKFYRKDRVGETILKNGYYSDEG